VPSLKQISEAVEGLFVMEDLHNFGTDYDKTLLAWDKNFETNWKKIEPMFDGRFFRMWRYYLLMSAGVFRARGIQLWQFIYSKRGVPGGYQNFIQYQFS